MSMTIVIFSDAETPADEKLPLEVLSKFNGKTREVTMLFTDSVSHHMSQHCQDLIKLLVTQRTTIETQGKKITDLETYIDSLLSKVIEVAPVVLQKDIRNTNRCAVMHGYFNFNCQQEALAYSPRRPYFNQVFNKRSKFG